MTAQKAKTKIAVIEDEHIFFEIIKTAISIFNCHFFYFNSTDNIAENILKEEIDLIILDFTMPQKDGLEIANEIRENAKLAKIPIIFLTSRDLNTEQLIKVRHLNLSYMPKPFVPHLLKSKITELLSH